MCAWITPWSSGPGSSLTSKRARTSARKKCGPAPAGRASHWMPRTSGQKPSRLPALRRKRPSSFRFDALRNASGSGPQTVRHGPQPKGNPAVRIRCRTGPESGHDCRLSVRRAESSIGSLKFYRCALSDSAGLRAAGRLAAWTTPATPGSSESGALEGELSPSRPLTAADTAVWPGRSGSKGSSTGNPSMPCRPRTLTRNPSWLSRTLFRAPAYAWKPHPGSLQWARKRCAFF